jgi:very-short-patch-repair endonuclease
MKWIVLSVAATIALACVATLLLIRRPRLPKAFPVTAKPLLSPPERQLYARLVRAFPGHIILAQVALSQLLVVTRQDAASRAQSISNRFRQLVADFVLCAPDFSAVAVVELDDRSHLRNTQRERDHRKDSFLQAAGIKVLRVTVADMPNEQKLKALLAAVPTAFPSKQLAEIERPGRITWKAAPISHSRAREAAKP